MKSLNILIVEDNTITAMDLRETLEGAGHRITVTARTFQSALKSIIANPADLALIDIELEGSTANGIDTAKELLAHHDMPIIYLTANSEPKTFQSAKETRPAAYLLKPFRAEELLFNIEVAYHYFHSILANPTGESVSDHLFLPVGKGHEKIQLDEVLYVKADGAYVKVVMADKQTHTVSTNLSHLEQYFRTPNFFRLSRFHLINLDYIKRLKDNGLVLSDGTTVLPVPTTSRKELMKRLTVVKTK